MTAAAHHIYFHILTLRRSGEFADKSEAITLSTVQQCCQINSELLVDQRILPILQQCEAWTVKGESTPFDGFSKIHTICSKCISL